MPFSLKIFPFKRLLISLLIFSVEIIELILNIPYSIVVFILLKSALPILKKNLTIEISIFVVLLFVKKIFNKLFKV